MILSTRAYRNARIHQRRGLWPPGASSDPLGHLPSKEYSQGRVLSQIGGDARRGCRPPPAFWYTEVIMPGPELPSEHARDIDRASINVLCGVVIHNAANVGLSPPHPHAIPPPPLRGAPAAGSGTKSGISLYNSGKVE